MISYSTIYETFVLQMQTNVLGSPTLPRPMHWRSSQYSQNLHSRKVIKMSHGSLVHVGKKTLTDLQILTVNCSKMRLAAGLCPDPLGEL